MSKYYLSLCCIIKNERYLEQFIVYHNLLGVEHFYIYDNDSSIPIFNRLDKPYFHKLCTVINFPGHIQQLNAYNNCIEKYGSETKWLITIDGDEYILPKKDNNIPDFLSKYEDAHAVGINWIMFGSNYHDKIQNGYLIDKYRRCSNTQNEHIKTIFQPKYADKFTWNPHHLNMQHRNKYIDAKRNIISKPFNSNHTTDIIQINHYHHKSTEDTHEKHKRGFPGNMRKPLIPDNLHALNNDIIDNLLADKYLDKVKSYFDENGNILLGLNIENNMKPVINNTKWFAFKKHWIKLNNKQIKAIQETFLKINRNIHSNELDTNSKKKIYKDDILDLSDIQNDNDYFVIIIY